ncbi:WecB/TagA/CpsF family glycosyltransferase [Flavobacterium daemonense]|nr:WecB/TagA/CpsF family glycosyltransferase [Flavobacterium daemonense]
MTQSTSIVPLLDYSIHSGGLSQCVTEGKTLISTINQYSYCIAEEDADFKKALQQSDILLPDGIGIVAAIKLVKNRNITKIAGADIHCYLLNELNNKGGRCFYLGSSQNTLDKIFERLSKEFPNIVVDGFSPPYKKEFTDSDNQQMINAINNFEPEVLFIGMTAPKQEKWAYYHKQVLDAKVICSIGAVFDFYAGTIKRPNSFWINSGLEWFARLMKEPKRMWKRYLYYGPIFIKIIIKKKIVSMFNRNTVL